MITIKRTNSENLNFQKLVKELDIDLGIYYKEEKSFYGKLNAIEAGIKATYDKVPTRVEKGGKVPLVEENVGEIFVKEDDGSVVYIYKDKEGSIQQKRLY
mgnify:CR=1 FL=1